MIAAIESYLGKPVPRAAQPAPIVEVDFLPTYLKAIESFADLDLIAKSGMKFCIDSMYGAGGTILSDIFTRIGVAHVPIRSNPDPLFPGINPEPIEPQHPRPGRSHGRQPAARPASAPTATPTASARPTRMATSSIRTRSTPCCSVGC